MEILKICLESSHEVSHNKAFTIAANPKYDEY